LRMEQGRLREAEQIARGVLALEQLTLMMRLPAQTVLARVRARMGAPDGRALLTACLHDALATGEAQRAVPLYLGLVEGGWLAGERAACRQWLDSLAQLDLS